MPSSPLPAPELLKKVSLGLSPRIMGVINTTPDSFFAGSRANSVEMAVERALAQVEEGASIIDIGGVSTRPGSEDVDLETERARVIPVIRELAKRSKVQISVDTQKAQIAQEALDVGAQIINDVSALRADSNMGQVALKAKHVVLMHMLGLSPKTMQVNPQYRDVVAEVKEFLKERTEAFLAIGGHKSQIWIDPGIGFGKSLEHNLLLLKHIPEFNSIAPVVLGVSRKSFLGKISPDHGPEQRLSGSLAVANWAALSGVSILRVHDVKETYLCLQTLTAIVGA